LDSRKAEPRSLLQVALNARMVRRQAEWSHHPVSRFLRRNNLPDL